MHSEKLEVQAAVTDLLHAASRKASFTASLRHHLACKASRKKQGSACLTRGSLPHRPLRLCSQHQHPRGAQEDSERRLLGRPAQSNHITNLLACRSYAGRQSSFQEVANSAVCGVGCLLHSRGHYWLTGERFLLTRNLEAPTARLLQLGQRASKGSRRARP